MMIVLWIAIDLGLSIIVALVIRQFLLRIVLVKGTSMMDTLRSGDILLARVYGRKRDVERFDVVVCKFPGKKQLYIKRVIGLPGERISMADDVVCINDIPLRESFSRRKCLRRFEEVALTDDEYFLMGDNRPVSVDSRRVGPIHRKDIVCRTAFVLFPWKNHGRVD